MLAAGVINEVLYPDLIYGLAGDIICDSDFILVVFVVVVVVVVTRGGAAAWVNTAVIEEIIYQSINIYFNPPIHNYTCQLYL